MKIFIDTAEVEAIRRFARLGVLDGVTTNPTLVKKSGRDFKEVIAEICDIVPGCDVSAEVLSEDAGGMVAEARECASWKENIVIKIPMTAEGLVAANELRTLGIRTNVTLVFSASQALLAAKAGASFVSPFVGRLDDASSDGMLIVEEIVDIYSNYGYETEIIVASVRHPLHVVTAARMGAHIATIPPGVLDKMLGHPLTDKGVDTFLKDAGKR